MENHEFPLIHTTVGKKQPTGRGNFSHPFVRGENEPKKEKKPSDKRPQ